MKTSLFLISLDPLFQSGEMTLFDAVDFAAKQGFDAVEPYPVLELLQPDIEFAQKFRTYCEGKGLAIPCFSMGIRLEGPDWRESVRRLKQYADVAAALGASLLHHTLVPTLERDRECFPFLHEILPQLTNACREVAEYARTLGVTCVYEDQGYVVNGVEDYAAFYQTLDWPDKGVVLDTGNIRFADQPVQDFAARFGNQVRHVHVKDYLHKPSEAGFPGSGWYRSRRGDWLRGTVLGHGVTDFTGTLRLLLQSGYEGYYAIEYDGMEPPRQAVALGLQNLRFYMEEAKRQLAVFQAKEFV